MRSSKGLVTVLAVAMLAVSTVAVAGAFISSSSGQVIQLSSPPASVKLNALENATSVVAFDEVQGATLAAQVAVDAVNPGSYTSFPNGSAKIAAGTVVDSQLIHSDIPSKNYTARRTGSVTFSDDILGVVASTARLAASDNLGAPGTLYAGTTTWRGLEGSSENGWSSVADKFTISADRRTVTFDVRTYVMDEIRVITRHTNPLVTTISDSPDPVTAGNDVQYTLTVTNNGIAPIANVHVVDTLPPGTSLVTATAPGGCTGTGPVDCTLGTLGVTASAQAKLVVTSPGTVPAGGTITNSAVASPGTNAQGSETTTVEEPQDGVSKGFVVPGGEITIPGDNPATLTLPNTGSGAPVIITQDNGTFCDGPCTGPATTISDFDGYTETGNPIHLTLTYTFPDTDPNSLTNAAIAYGATIYKNDDPEHPSAGVPVSFCTSPGAGVAVPHPCVDARSITQPTPNFFVVSFEVLYISGDPKFGKR